MIKVTVELWPFGDSKHPELLGEAFITNDGTGDRTKGNYRAVFKGRAGQYWKAAWVSDFPRKKLLAWDLLFRALHAIVGNRNGCPVLEFRGNALDGGDNGSKLVKHLVVGHPQDREAFSGQ